LAFLFAFVYAEYYGSAHHNNGSVQDRLLAIFDHVAHSMETLLRGFALGFGTRMLMFMFLNDDEAMAKLPQYSKISFWAGLAMASVIFGSSMIIPSSLRALWFDGW